MGRGERQLVTTDNEAPRRDHRAAETKAEKGDTELKQNVKIRNRTIGTDTDHSGRAKRVSAM